MVRFRIAWILLLIFSSITARSAVNPDYWGGHESMKSLRFVPESLLIDMQLNGKADYFMVLANQADFSESANRQNRISRGDQIFHLLRLEAESTQPMIIDDLSLCGAVIQRFHIQNMILVRDGTPDMLIQAANHHLVSEIRANPAYDFVNEQPESTVKPEVEGSPEWHLTHIGIPDIWNAGFTGETIVVANLDTGVDWTHPALQSKYRGWDGMTATHDYNWHATTSSWVCPYPAVPCDFDEFVSGGHGTHTMGTIVGHDGHGNRIGGAPGAQWIACGPLVDAAGFHECFEWFLAPYRYGETPAQGIPAMAPHVINNSWGLPVGGGDYRYAPDIDALHAAGIFTVFAAGNEGDNCRTLRSPGDYPQVLTVGASDSQNRIVSAFWAGWGSSRGPAHSNIPGAPDFIKPEITAPGHNIRSSLAGGGYASWGGTSMAAPVVTSVVALLWSAAPDLIGDIEATRQLVLNNSFTAPGGAGYHNQTCQGINANNTSPNHVWGWGLIDAYASYDGLTGVYLDKPAYKPDDEMIIRVLDSGAQGTVTVQIKSTIEQEWEILNLTEVASGHYQGTFLTTSGPPQHGDGAVSVEHGSIITVWYQAKDATATAMADGEPPIISNVQVTHVDTTSFSVSWQTDEPARSIFRYGTHSPDNDVHMPHFSTEHRVHVTGLNYCTYYLFDIIAEDIAGNVGDDDNNGMYYGVQTYEIAILMNENMDADPGWTYEGLWEWGPASGQNGNPPSGYTGTHIVGYNLTGHYSNNMPVTYCTATAVDCSNASTVTLGFYYWLCIENSEYDKASVQVSGDNGVTWATVWEHDTGTQVPSDWTYLELDITQIASGGSHVRVRWVMGPTDGSVALCGWNIDDVSITAAQPCTQVTPTPQPTHTPTQPPTATPQTNTPTPTPTSTQEPTITPSATPTDALPPTITPTPTTPVNTPTPTPTVSEETPTPTPVQPTATETPDLPCNTLGAIIEMPSDHFRPGDLCYLTVYLCNPGPGLGQTILFVILDVYGELFFAPSFGEFDYYSINLVHGLRTRAILNPFFWPEGAGTASGIHWYAGMTDTGISDVIGLIDMFAFEWSE